MARRVPIDFVWPLAAGQKHGSEQKVALVIAGVFLVMGSIWVLMTDVILYEITQDPLLVARLEIAKGWIFVGVTAVLLYIVAWSGAARLTRAQQLMSAVVDSIADGVLLLGPNRTIVHANPAAVRMLGCERQEDLLGMDAAEFSRRYRVTYPDGSLVPPDELASQRVFVEGGPLNYKAIMYPPRGEPLVISATAAPVRSKVGEPPETVVSVLHDITASERLEALRNQFLATAAHALKTPIAIIKAHVQLLASGAPELHRSTEPIERQCDRIDRLVLNMLVLARLRTRTLQLHPRVVELGPLVQEVAREVAKTSLHHQLRTEFLASPRVRGDRERLALSLRNMVDAALRTSVLGSALTVLLTQQGADAQIGIRYEPLPPEQRTMSAALGEQYDDLRVNRSVATTIVEAHGGTLGEESQEREVTAWIRLPAMGEPRGPA
jgi:two-component system, OmpR family, phosphate regulon sensor histidine kinase PhoR